MTFAELLTTRMTESGYTDRALAKELGVSHQTVVCWRNGETIPGMQHGEKLSRALAIPTARLLEACAKPKGGE